MLSRIMEKVSARKTKHRIPQLDKHLDMEKTKEVKLSPQQDHPREDEPKPEEVINQEEKAIPPPEQNGALADSKAEDEENGKETTEEEKVLEASTVEAEEKEEEEEKDLVKKPNGLHKPNKKLRCTVPQPFSLATEKRMSRERQATTDTASAAEKKVPRERRRSMDLDAGPPKLAPSISFNKEKTPSTTKPIAKPEYTGSRNATTKGHQNGVKNQSKVQVTKEAESQVATKKQQGKASETGKLAKSSTFKALPLPSFYHKNEAPAKPSIKKVPVTQPKSPLLGVRNRGTNPTGQKTGSTPRTITDSTKDKLTKFLNEARKVLNPSKETVKPVAATA